MHDWEEVCMMMAVGLFDMVLNRICMYFVDNFCIYVHMGNWFVIIFFVESFKFWYWGDCDIIKN